jgi:hypothetical protein
LHDRADNCVYFGRAGFVEILQHRRSEISERRAHFGTLGGRHPGVEPDPTLRCRRLFEQIGTQLAQARFGHKRPHMDDRPNHPVGGNRAGKRTFRIERRQGDIRPVFRKSVKKITRERHSSPERRLSPVPETGRYCPKPTAWQVPSPQRRRNPAARNRPGHHCIGDER